MGLVGEVCGGACPRRVNQNCQESAAPLAPTRRSGARRAGAGVVASGVVDLRIGTRRPPIIHSGTPTVAVMPPITSSVMPALRSGASSIEQQYAGPSRYTSMRSFAIDMRIDPVINVTTPPIAATMPAACIWRLAGSFGVGGGSENGTCGP